MSFTVFDNLPQKVVSIVVGVIAMLILLQQVDTITGHLNGLYIQLAKAEYCVYKSEPFDRVNAVDFKKTFPYTWASGEQVSDITMTGLGAGKWTKLLTVDAGKCDYDSSGTIASSATKLYTPQGTEVPGVAAATTQIAKSPSSANGRTIPIENGGVVQMSFLTRYSSVTSVMASLFGIGIPLALMFMMGSVGAIFIDKLVNNGGEAIDSVVGQIIMVVIVVVIATSIFGLMTGGIQFAFESIDPNRFAMYDNVLGRLSSVAVGFWGLMLVAGFVPLAFALTRSRMSLGGGN